jgi:hypothetical protein
MTSTQKSKIYKNFVSFLNNHFKPTSFKKDIYEHCHLHCGFIAHYNINGFYGEYFGTAARFHKIANGRKKGYTGRESFTEGGLVDTKSIRRATKDHKRVRLPPNRGFGITGGRRENA